jgi:hypothetical protein
VDKQSEDACGLLKNCPLINRTHHPKKKRRRQSSHKRRAAFARTHFAGMRDFLGIHSGTQWPSTSLRLVVLIHSFVVIKSLLGQDNSSNTSMPRD